MRRAAPRGWVLALLALAPTLPVALGEHGGDPFVHDGWVHALHPAHVRVSEEAWVFLDTRRLDHVDAEVVPLPEWASGHWLTVTGSRPPYDLNVGFYDADHVWYFYHSCLTSDDDEACIVPDGAAYAVVKASCCFRIQYRILWTPYAQLDELEPFRLTVHPVAPS